MLTRPRKALNTEPRLYAGINHYHEVGIRIYCSKLAWCKVMKLAQANRFGCGGPLTSDRPASSYREANMTIDNSNTIGQVMKRRSRGMVMMNEQDASAAVLAVWLPNVNSTSRDELASFVPARTPVRSLALCYRTPSIPWLRWMLKPARR